MLSFRIRERLWEINLEIPPRVKESREIIKVELFSYNYMSLDPVNWEIPQSKIDIYVVTQEYWLPCLTEQLASELKLILEIKPKN